MTCVAVFLDRDGVINPVVLKNGKPHPPLPSEYQLYPFVSESIKKLKNQGFKVFVFTNQPDVSTGIISAEQLEQIHAKVLQETQIDEIAVCIHLDEHQCDCRKPKPGMISELAKEHKIDLISSFVIGDRWRDIEAGLAAGCKTILIGNGYGEKEISPLFQSKNLEEAVEIIIRNKNS